MIVSSCHDSKTFFKSTHVIIRIRTQKTCNCRAEYMENNSDLSPKTHLWKNHAWKENDRQFGNQLFILIIVVTSDDYKKLVWKIVVLFSCMFFHECFFDEINNYFTYVELLTRKCTLYIFSNLFCPRFTFARLLLTLWSLILIKCEHIPEW